MSRFLSNLVQRSMGQPSTVMPRLAGRYESIQEVQPEAHRLETAFARETASRAPNEPMHPDLDAMTTSPSMTQQASRAQAMFPPMPMQSSPTMPAPQSPADGNEVASTQREQPAHAAPTHTPVHTPVHPPEPPPNLSIDMGPARKRPVARVEMDLNALDDAATDTQAPSARPSPATPRGVTAVMALLTPPPRQMPSAAIDHTTTAPSPDTSTQPKHPPSSAIKPGPLDTAPSMDEPRDQRQWLTEADTQEPSPARSKQRHQPSSREDREDSPIRAPHLLRSGLLLDQARTQPPMAAMALPEAASAEQAAAAPTVHVTIGRIELRAAGPAPTATASRQPVQRPTVSLRDYLERRNAPGRR
ncbi:MAG: hypothetical protein EKK47_07410 [Burkholderiales bacterium]|jgi:hypothetical protein|nr:MAG: hypothetical protein EKK47_07410 [Burkholderiales bacterium]